MTTVYYIEQIGSIIDHEVEFTNYDKAVEYAKFRGYDGIAEYTGKTRLTLFYKETYHI